MPPAFSVSAGRSIYRLINSGVLPTVRIGRSRRIPIRAVHDLAATNLVCVSSPSSDEHKKPSGWAGWLSDNHLFIFLPKGMIPMFDE